MPGTPDFWQRAKRVVADALEREAGERDAFVAAACGGDSALLSEVRSLLAAHDSAGDALESPPPGAEGGSSLVGRRLGSYRVVRFVAEGGMGAVYEARQESPSRRVAIKVMRHGLFLGDAARRFRHEAEILGRLQHRAIAQVFEAGVASGPHSETLPWFAMEWIDGEPLTRYAARRSLSIRDRLALFARVCEGVDWAHRRGVVHRDLKPDNVLVDAAGEPKILDFGIARATAADSGVATLKTEIGQLLGTLPYMSPEQAKGDPGAIDLRSDVYSLGVMLYELLSGRLPADFARTTVPAALRAIEEEDAPPLGSLDPALGGDLEVIAAKALEKDRERRYGSASELAADLARFSNDEPIVARPPSALYAFSKFARRNRGLVGGVAAAFVVLVAGVIGTSIGLVRATRAREAALEERDRAIAAEREAAAIAAFLNRTLEAADPEDAGGEPTVRALLASAARDVEWDFADRPLVRARLHETLGRTYRGLGATALAEKHARSAADLFAAELGGDDPATFRARILWGEALADADDLAAAASVLEATAPLTRERLGPRHPVTLDGIEALALLRHSQGDLALAEALHREAIAGRVATLGAAHDATLSAKNNLSGVLLELGRPADAEALLRDVVAAREKSLGPTHPRTLTSLSNLALALDDGGARSAEAIALYRRVIEAGTVALGADHPRVLTARNNLGAALLRLGAGSEREHETEGIDLLAGALADRRRVFGARHEATRNSMSNLAIGYLRIGRYAEAETLARELVDLGNAAGDPALWLHLDTLSSALGEQHRNADAEPFARRALALVLERLGAENPRSLAVRNNLARTLQALERRDEALALFEENLAIARRVAPGAPPTAIQYPLNLGRCLVEMGRLAEAEEPLLSAARAALAAAGDGGSPARTELARKCADALVALYEAWGKPAEAAEWRSRR